MPGKSVYAITKRFNLPGDGFRQTFSGKKWTASLVKYYLRSRAVIGEYQPKRIIGGKRVDEGEPVAGFYEPIIERADFDRAQARFKVVPSRNGRPPADESVEILSGLVRCPYCGGSIGVQESKYPNRMACNKAFENACVRVSVSRHFVEWAAAASTDEIFNSMSLGKDDAKKIQALEGQAEQIGKRITNLMEFAQDGDPRAKAKIRELREEERKVREELEKERNLELTAEDDGDAFVQAFVTNKMTPEIRRKAMLHIRRFVAKVEPFYLGDKATYDAYRAELIKADSKPKGRQSVWLKLRKKYKVEERQFIRITFTRPVDGKTEKVFTYPEYLANMEACEVTPE